ncbi:DNA polymerase III subunit alpha [Natribacillus halophilus]|uniref:DNA polymerase III subunit alpha n=1 Tax=Natribacillus halophilus TaxID=549003 RepID=A0A1G8NCK8_9BACI|nr:DNA polymerase III subunit alpha [Natribacillus halophilus]SDI77865.1 DNA polymerase-3 subunit alpha [Natribacillus halophilus]
MDSFVHLQVRSEYSLLTSTCRIDDLVDRAADLGYDTLALTDRNVMYGIHKFYQRCRQREIKPLLGLELDLFFADGTNGTLLLQAMNLKGYQQLMALSTQAQTRSSPGVDADFFYRHCSDLVVIIPEKTSHIAQFVQKEDKEAAREAMRDLQEKIGADRLYAGSFPPHVPESEAHHAWVAFAEEMKIKRVACGNVAFLHENDEKWRRCLEAIRSDRPIENVSPLEWRDEHPLFTPSVAKAAWELDKEALAHTVEVRDRCSVNLEQLQTTLPAYEDENESAHNKLRRICWQGANERYTEVDERVAERLEHELAVIERIAFADYFLIVWDFMSYARNAGILTGPGRGSAAGSLVAYCLYITDVDPLAYGLLFERFLNEERVSLPDIDIDFPDHRREEVISYVRETYGNRHVAQIITFGTFGARAALRDAGKALGTPQSFIEQAIRALPQSGALPLKTSRTRDEKLAGWLKENERAETLFQYAEAIEGLPRHTSLHAAGVVLSARPLADIVPTLPGELTAVTQWPMEDVEAYGLLKIDFLGLRNLTLLERLRDTISARYQRTIHPESIPQDDEETLAMLAAGDTTGIFQFESAGMQQVLKKLKPTTFEDLVAVNALYRPGPMEQIDTYIDGKHGRRTINYVHDDLQPILSSTYGVMVYQEQIMQVAVQIAGYSLAQADLLRRAVSKKNRQELENEKAAFIAGARANGYDEATAEKVYSWILRFADYGFNRSHAVAYSFIAYQLAYYKTHYPHVFFSAYMSMVENDNSRLGRAIREMRNHGLRIYPPSINKSTERFAIEKEGVRFPLQTIAQVGRQFSRRLLQERNNGGPFQSFIHFCERTTRLPITRRMLANLIKAGAFDELHRDRAMLLASIDRAFEFVDFQQDLGPLFEGGSGDFRYAEATPFSPEECYRLEKEVTGFYMSGHPLDQYEDIITIRHPLLIAELEQAPVKKELWVMGAIEQLKHIRTKNGQTMAFLQLSDESQTCEVVIFPAIYRKVNHVLEEESYVFIRGKRTVDQYGHKVIAEDVIPVEQARAEASDVLYIKLLADKEVNAQSRRLKRMLQKEPGFSQVRVYNEKTQQLYALADHYRVRINEELRTNLKSLVGEKNIVERKNSAPDR